MSSDTSPSQAAVIPPPIPHVDINQIQLSQFIRNLTIFTIKEIQQFIKTNSNKINFLKLTIFLRNQFLKLYVLIKWSKTIKNNNFNMLIDLLNWFRLTNLNVNNSIWSLKNIIVNMSNAKLPNVDLITSLQVLSLGKPYLIENSTNQKITKIPKDLILKKLKYLNLLISIKISLIDYDSINKFFANKNCKMEIKNGSLTLSIKDEFTIKLSTIDINSSFFLTDLKIFNNMNKNFIKFEKIINEILLKSNFNHLFDFLHNFVITFKIYLIHLKLLSLQNQNNNNYNINHIYNSKKNLIEINYWLNSINNDTDVKILIGINHITNNLCLKWINGGNSLTYFNDDINILDNLETLLDEILYNHANLIKIRILTLLNDNENDKHKNKSNETNRPPNENDNNNSSNNDILFNLPITCSTISTIKLNIDLKSGLFYFKNPSDLLKSYTKKINSVKNLDSLINTLQQLKLDKITQILTNMFEKTNWLINRNISINDDEDDKDLKNNNILKKHLYIYLSNWPQNWYLILTIVSSNASCILQKKIGKIISTNNSWNIVYNPTDGSTKHQMSLQTFTYKKIITLKKNCLKKIINHMIIDSLNQLNIQNKICTNDMLPDYINESTPVTSFSYSPIIALNLSSFLNLSSNSHHTSVPFESSLFLKIDYMTSEIKLVGKLKKNLNLILTKYTINDLNINLVYSEPLAFFIKKTFKNLNLINSILLDFKKNFNQLLVITDVIDKLNRNFNSENFKIISLKPNKILFKYLKHTTLPENPNDEDSRQDCTIEIISNNSDSKNLNVILSKSNPQYIIQPFINNMNYHFIFNYLQFTSNLFGTLNQIITSSKRNLQNYEVLVNFNLHNLYSYQMIFYVPKLNKSFNLLLDIKNLNHNNLTKLQYFVHFTKAEELSNMKTLGYSLIRKVQKQIFSIDPQELKSASNLFPKAIRLMNGIACDSDDIGNIILEIYKIFKLEEDTSLQSSASPMNNALLNNSSTNNNNSNNSPIVI